MAEQKATFQIWRGYARSGRFREYTTEVLEGMVVLDAVHQIQARQANDLAVRWNCKAGKCGSCSAEINGHPKLMCMTRMNEFPAGEHITISPVKTFPSSRISSPMSRSTTRRRKRPLRSTRSPKTPTANRGCTRKTSI